MMTYVFSLLFLLPSIIYLFVVMLLHDGVKMIMVNNLSLAFSFRDILYVQEILHMILEKTSSVNFTCKISPFYPHAHFPKAAVKPEPLIAQRSCRAEVTERLCGLPTLVPTPTYISDG